MSNVPETFGNLVFNDRVMQERLPKETYKALKKTVGRGKGLHPLHPLVPAHDRHHRREA